MNYPSQIIKLASKYAGIEELKSNTSWYDKQKIVPQAISNEFKILIKQYGHEDGAPYCASFARSVYLEVFKTNEKHYKLFNKLLSASVMRTYNNLQIMGYITKSPQIGAIMLMQMSSTSKGHCGIVVDIDIDSNSIKTIEANTSDTITTREGDGVYIKNRNLSLFNTKTGLHIIGFLNLEKILLA